jgi:hypothetical protein
VAYGKWKKPIVTVDNQLLLGIFREIALQVVRHVVEYVTISTVWCWALVLKTVWAVFSRVVNTA